MTGSRAFCYIDGDQVTAGDLNLRGLPLANEGNQEPIGELDGLLIDLDERRVSYLVIEAADTGKKHLLPFDGTSLDPRSHVLERVNSEDLTSCPVFDPSTVERYDEDAAVSLMFRSTAA